MKCIQLMTRGLLVVCLLLAPASMVIAAEPAAADAYTPSGSVSGQSAEDVFGPRKGNWHPSLAISEAWTDNLFNDSTNEESELITVVTPGLWLAFPARFDQPESLQSVNTAPGGLAYSVLQDSTDYGTYQVYAAYSANLEAYQEFSDKNQTTHKAEAKLGFYPGAKTRVELFHVFDLNREAFGTGTAATGQEDLFTGNSTNLSLSYMLTRKLNLRVTGGFYSLRYADAINRFRERNDWSVSGRASFELAPKVDLFAEYERVEVIYQTAAALDSESDHLYAGVEWDVTDKTRGLVKLGYNVRNITGASPDGEELQAELQLGYQYSTKTALTLRGLRQLNETDIAGTTDRLTSEVGGDVSYQLTPKVNATVNFSWLRDEYQGVVTIGPLTAEREDDYLQAGAGISWQIKSWLTAGCGYAWENRESNFDGFDYTSNSAYVNISAAL